ncbi:MAG: alcohol dehydrogenase catalytic domain-containing protein [Kiritimatiellae bacterium]|nr:alcohol dehydrogenase catalytic domain-containing protein [Kiritimatiellia bacterium]
MKAKAWRLYGASDLRLEDVELGSAGEDGVVVEIVANSVCVSDYKCVTLGAGHKRVPGDIATHPVMVGHEMSGIVREVGEKWKSQFSVGQHVGIQPTLNVPGHELDSVIGYSWRGAGGQSTHVRLPSIVMEMGCLLPYGGDAFFKCSLAEPISCVLAGLRANYHNEQAAHAHVQGIRDGGAMLLMAGCGAMGLGCVDIACNSPERRPRRLVVTDVDEARLSRAARVFGLEGNGERGVVARGNVNGVELVFANTRHVEDPVAFLKGFNSADGEAECGYDDIFVMAAVPALLSQCSELLAYDGCLNFFAGPKDKNLAASFNFYNVHYMMHHVAANSGSLVCDMVDSVDWIGRGVLHPEVMVTHVGGLDSAADATLSLMDVPGGKRLVYTHVAMPMTAIADFAEKGKTDPLFAELDRICSASSGLWSKEAEDFLLANAPRVEIGEPKETIEERRLS